MKKRHHKRRQVSVEELIRRGGEPTGDLSK